MRLKARIFWQVPLSIKLQTIFRVFTFRDFKSVMSEAVADSDLLGYGRLYIMFLENSKFQFRKVFQVLGEADSYPLLIHCVHGCAALHHSLHHDALMHQNLRRDCATLLDLAAG
jgi:uncharacterized protein YbgA (DUF1722 family)